MEIMKKAIVEAKNTTQDEFIVGKAVIYVGDNDHWRDRTSRDGKYFIIDQLCTGDDGELDGFVFLSDFFKNCKLESMPKNIGKMVIAMSASTKI